MSENISLTEIEKKAYLSYHQDGFTDMALGLSFLLFGLVLEINQPALIAFWGIIIAMMMLIKKWITSPRIGLVKFSPERRFREFKTAVGVLPGCLLLFLLFVFKINIPFLREEFNNNYLLFAGMVFLFLPVMLGVSTGISRFFLYNFLFLVTLIFSFGMKYRISFAFIYSGFTFIIIGGIVLIRFLRRYSKRTEVSYD